MFTDNMNRWLQGVLDFKSRFNLTRLFYPLFDRLTSQVLSASGAGLTISGTATKVKAGNAFYFIANGILATVAANTDMAVLSGTVVNGTFNVFCFFVDSGGNLTSAMGIAGSTLAKVTFPQFPEGKACIGFVVINPTGTGNFVGGTTALNDGTVTPNAAYVSTDGAWDPACLTGLSVTP